MTNTIVKPNTKEQQELSDELFGPASPVSNPVPKQEAGPNRTIIMDVAESVTLPQEIELKLNNNWVDYQIKSKSVVVPFLVSGRIPGYKIEYPIEFMVWGSFQDIDKKVIPAELVKVCLEIQKLIKAEQALRKFYNQEKKQEVIQPDFSDEEIDRAYNDFCQSLNLSWVAA